MCADAIPLLRIAPHVFQCPVPAPTLPPAFSTNTYLIAKDGEGVVVDNGTDDPDAIQALLDTIRSAGVRRVTALIATHHHRDHTSGLPALHRAFQAPVYIHPLDRTRLTWPAADTAALEDAPPALSCAGIALHLRHCPGHTHGHLHVEIPGEDVILVGDHLAGQGSVWIGPPDGHMASYFRALDAIAASGCRIAGPGHGPVLKDAAAAARQLKERREGREAEVLNLLAERPRTLGEIVGAIYGDTVPPGVRLAARRTVQAHLQHLLSCGLAKREFDADRGFIYRLPNQITMSGRAPTAY
ncbi:MAG: MBL fold metallo-hydrolase [Alicyclobacillus macrosporangiidus]|uniref:MBL fold metallo-hydrolase n=1 Tax=Alicyclobacillus macrosporangiidus TaxID=392015 RepID=UPI0026ED34FC|nr:MBL fold metallo-hydrolase [Alicyclobacillus macrosporangiidus]MCL6600481.1 MBL fold metallo-hydrolase [Alicyclobacillus macrosporangiidus]